MRNLNAMNNNHHNWTRNWIKLCSLLAAAMLVFFSTPAADADQKKDSTAIDWTDIAYKKAKIMSGHAGPEETLSLIKKLTDLGHLKTARELIDKSSLPRQYKAKVLDAKLGIESAEYFQLKENDGAKEKIGTEVRRILLQLSEEKQIDTADLIRHEQRAEEFGVGEAVIIFCTQLAESDPDGGDKWWHKAGRWCMNAQKTRQAVFFYQKAYDSASSQQDRQKYFISKLKALQADGQNKAMTSEISAAVKEGMDADTLRQLATISLTAERPDLAWPIYGRLVVADPENATQWLDETVRWALAAKQPIEAAHFLESSTTKTVFSEEQQEALLRNRFTLLLHGGLPKDAVIIAEKLITRIPDDVGLLEKGVQVALASGNVALAEKWNRKLLQIQPENSELLKQQAQISMAYKQPEKALESIRRIYQRNPNDRQIQRQLAQLEEWTGNPQAALVHWRQLSNIENKVDHHEQVYRLSRMLNEYSTAIEALQHIETLRRLTVDEIKERLSLYESLGETEKAVMQTTAYIEKHPENSQLWRELALLQMRSGEYRQAVKSWEKIAQNFGRSDEETLYRSECYWRSGEKRQALEVIDSYDGKLSSPDNFYHASLLVELGWRYQRPELALSSFSSLTKNYDKEHFFIVERILLLQQESGAPEKAVQLAVQSAERTKDSRFITLALNIASASFKDKQIDALLKKLNTTAGNFDTVPFYWIIQAQRKFSQADYRAAFELYQRALALDSGLIVAKEGTLWSLLSLNDRKNLRNRLDEWQAQAQTNQELWLVYALARQHLDQHRLASVWYEQLIEIGNMEYGVLLGYADTLDAMGAADRAFRLRMWTLQKLRPEAAAFLQNPGKLTETLKTYIGLMHRYGSAQQGEYWLKLSEQLDGNKTPTPWVYELAVSWYLNNQCRDEAKLWLAKAHQQRISTPMWQKIVLAIEENNPKQLEAILDSGDQLDPDSKIAILAKLDRRQEALRLSESGINPKREDAKSSAARMYAASLKQDFPDYWNAGYDTSFSDQLDIRSKHVEARYSLDDMPIGVGITLNSKNYFSPIYYIEDHGTANDLALTAYIGDGSLGGSAAAGLNHHEADAVIYGLLECHRQFTDAIKARLELDLQSVPDGNSILNLATVQNRLDAIFMGSVAKNYYYYMDLWARELMTRTDIEVARGAGAAAEIGIKQHWGRFEWLTGVQGNYERNFERFFPEYLREMLPPSYTVDSVTALETATLLIGGRFSRGAIREDYPSAGSIRYFASAWIGHTWPAAKPAINLEAGVGIRILGNDELSLKSHYNQSGDVVGRNDDTGGSIQYCYHF